MSERIPTLDNLLLGIGAGAAVGGVSLLLSWQVREEVIPNVGFLLGGSLAAGLILLLALPIVFMPIWWITHLVGLRGALSGVIAGALTFVAPWLLLLLLTEFSMTDPGRVLAWLAHMAVPGALAGLVIWRVSNWSVDAH